MEKIDGQMCDQIFAPLQRFSTVVLAVSGGPDSLALLHLIADWLERTSQSSTHYVVATVDHGLRAESAAEARFVETQAANRGLAHQTLRWRGPKPEAGIQAEARDARYQLLAEFASSQATDHGPAAVVTAHTRDDVAETFLMRLARGTGLDGLSAMTAFRRLEFGEDCWLLRPLLALSKDHLIADLGVRGQKWLEDPSNSDPRFERARLRSGIGPLADLGIKPEAISRTAGRLRRARSALEYATDQLAEQAKLNFNNGVFAQADRHVFAAAPQELRLRLIARLVSAFGGQSEPPRLSKIEALDEDIPNAGTTRRTLGGCIVDFDRDLVRVWREPERSEFPDLTLRPGATVLFDGRFELQLEPDAPDALEIHALSAEGGRLLVMDTPEFAHIPVGALAGLPALWRSGHLVGVAGINWRESEADRANATLNRGWSARFLARSYNASTSGD